MPAAGTNTITTTTTNRPTRVSFAWTSNASGAVNGTLSSKLGGVISRVVFVPGTSTAQPTDLYDVTLLDEQGMDVLAGKGADLSNATATQVCPLIGDGTTTNQPVAVNGTLELKVANAGNAKSGAVHIYLT